MTIGSTELDNFLRSGSLSSSTSGIGSVLSSVMTSAKRHRSFIGRRQLHQRRRCDLSRVASDGVGCTTASGGQCDPSVANDLASQGQQKVNDIVNVDMSSEYGFSQMSQMTKGTSGGFASMGCLDKLFQNSKRGHHVQAADDVDADEHAAELDVPAGSGVASQISGRVRRRGSSSRPPSLGGFFPLSTYGEANDGTKPDAPELSVESGGCFREPTSLP